MHEKSKQMLKWSDKNLIAVILKVPQKQIKNSFETNKKLGNLSKEVAVIKNPMKIVELKKFSNQSKTCLDGLSSTMKMIEDWTSEFEDRSIE